MQRRFKRISGIIKDIQRKNKVIIKKESEYIGLFGMIDFYYSRSSDYKKVFFVFKSATKPFRKIKTTPGILSYNEEGKVYLSTNNHRYIIEIIEEFDN